MREMTCKLHFKVKGCSYDIPRDHVELAGREALQTFLKRCSGVLCWGNKKQCTKKCVKFSLLLSKRKSNMLFMLGCV